MSIWRFGHGAWAHGTWARQSPLRVSVAVCDCPLTCASVRGRVSDGVCVFQSVCAIVHWRARVLVSVGVCPWARVRVGSNEKPMQGN